MKMYRVKKYRKFPRQSPKDEVIRTVDNLKEAQIISIELNKASKARYYVEPFNTEDYEV
ncbi:MAG TPA: hypothetical protein PLG10_03710 [Candidatus Dojkabacteria bacterium]|nr:hypothetical protein [Candidatus Dojkabacteria bacterium]